MTKDTQLELRKAFGAFMTGVTVVTAYTADGVEVGFTANSFTSVSLEPPLVLVCPSRALTSFDAFNTCESFTVNVLAEDQQEISNVFARPIDDRYSQAEWHKDSLGNPVFSGVSAFFSCTIHKRVDAGDHMVLIGEVLAFEVNDKPGLGYANGGYFSLGLERLVAEMPRASRPSHVGAIIEHENCVLLTSTQAGWRPPEVKIESRAGSLLKLRDHLLLSGISVQFGPVYAVFENQVGEYSTYYRGFSHDETSGGIGQYVPVEKLDLINFASPAIADMMKRWVLERKHGVFRLYVGDELQGGVHAVTAGEVP